MAIVVGFNFPPMHDNAAAVVIDGELVFACEEERFSRHKHSRREPPFNALLRTFAFLESQNISPQGIDGFAINCDPTIYSSDDRGKLLVGPLRSYLKSNGLATDDLLKASFDCCRKSGIIEATTDFLKSVFQSIGCRLEKGTRIVPILHHLTHAASAYYFSGFESAAVLTVDGRGERDSTVIWEVHDGNFERLCSIDYRGGSIGALYEYSSQRIGFGALEGPGKVMGLSSYGMHDENLYKRFENLLSPKTLNAPYCFHHKFANGTFHEMYGRIADYVSARIDLQWNPHGHIKPGPAKLARNLQDFTEELILRSVNWARDSTEQRNLAIAGGVGLNAKANMKILSSKQFENLFVFPAANDSGCAVGAAAYAHEHFFGGRMRRRELRNVSFGPSYGREHVKNVVKRSKWRADFVGRDATSVAALVAKGYVVAWWQGRSELGPRALGNRSIVADPRRARLWKVVNQIKGREPWRPLAPTVLLRDSDVYFETPVVHRFMTIAFRLTEEAERKVPAICHVDSTARPQMITTQENKIWYELIQSFKDITGEGIMINTSFNLAGEPLVETPEDALKSFSIGAFDALYLQGWLIRK